MHIDVHIYRSCVYLKNTKGLIVKLFHSQKNKLHESRIGIDEISDLSHRIFGGGHHETSAGGLTVDLEAAGLMVGPDPAGQERVGRHDFLQRGLKPGGGRLRWEKGIRREEVEGLDVEVEDLVDVG